MTDGEPDGFVRLKRDPSDTEAMFLVCCQALDRINDRLADLDKKTDRLLELAAKADQLDDWITNYRADAGLDLPAL